MHESSMRADGTELQPVERDTLMRIFAAGVRRFPEQDAVRHKHGGEWISRTYRQVEEEVARVAAGLRELGVGEGDRVAILSENRPEWLIADYAILSLGALTVPLYPTLPADQVAPILEDSGARVALASTPEQTEKLAYARDRIAGLEHLIALSGGAEEVMPWAELAERGDAAPGDPVAALRERVDSVTPDDVATLIYTSGTSGAPKGVMLTHYNLAYMVAATRQSGALPMEPGDVALSLLPLSHVLERAIDYCYWDEGVTIAYAESIQQAASNLREVRPHVMASVPRLFDKIYERVRSATGVKGRIVEWAERVGGSVVDARLAGRRPSLAARARHALADRLVFSKLREATGGRIRVFISGGAPLSPDVARFFLAAGLPIHEGYGLTETSPVLSANREGALRLGTVGRPYPGVRIRIAETGEILARSPGVMRGYWNRPDLEAVDEDGWFHTGDVGHLDADGFLWITDRLKDLIVTAGGKNIAPQPIEARAATSSYVDQAVMIGDRRPYPVLLVAPDWTAVRAWADTEEIELGDRAEASRHPALRKLLEGETLGRMRDLARFERPKRLAVLEEELTVESGLLTPTLKVRRRAVERRYQVLIERLYG